MPMKKLVNATASTLTTSVTDEQVINSIRDPSRLASITFECLHEVQSFATKLNRGFMSQWASEWSENDPSNTIPITETEGETEDEDSRPVTHGIREHVRMARRVTKEHERRIRELIEPVMDAACHPFVDCPYVKLRRFLEWLDSPFWPVAFDVFCREAGDQLDRIGRRLRSISGEFSTSADARSTPMSLSEMATRLHTPSTRKLKTMLDRHGLKNDGNRQLWSVRLDGLPANWRKALGG
jgi:hypothetical protein